MEELKPCPFCGGEAKFGVNKSCCGKTVRIDCTNPQCGANINAYSSKAEAKKVWNRRAEPENKPLTMERLRQMDGEPVWVKPTKGIAKWYLVDVAEEGCADCDMGMVDFELYGSQQSYGWLAYSHKPEGSEKP